MLHGPDQHANRPRDTQQAEGRRTQPHPSCWSSNRHRRGWHRGLHRTQPLRDLALDAV